MRKFFAAFAVFAVAASPAVAQTAPNQAAAAGKVETVTKRVCEEVVQRETGSRFGGRTKVCKTIEVPASATGKKAHDTRAQGHTSHSGHSH